MAAIRRYARIYPDPLPCPENSRCREIRGRTLAVAYRGLLASSRNQVNAVTKTCCANIARHSGGLLSSSRDPERDMPKGRGRAGVGFNIKLAPARAESRGAIGCQV